MTRPIACGAFTYCGRVFTYTTVGRLQVWGDVAGEVMEVEATPAIREAIWRESAKEMRKYMHVDLGDAYEEVATMYRSGNPSDGGERD